MSQEMIMQFRKRDGPSLEVLENQDLKADLYLQKEAYPDPSRITSLEFLVFRYLKMPLRLSSHLFSRYRKSVFD